MIKFIKNSFVSFGLLGFFVISGAPSSLEAKSRCAADLNGDGFVNRSDLQIVLDQWGSNGLADLNKDGIINGADLGMILAAWGPFCGSSVCPEDLTGDGYVDAGDIYILIENWTNSDPLPGRLGDLDGNGSVDGVDLGMMLAAYGPCEATNCSQRALVTSDLKTQRDFAQTTFGHLAKPGANSKKTGIKP